MNFYNGRIESLKSNQIFVFGSNPEGRHGLGSALIAKKKFGAIYANGRGIQGQSYALPTKNLTANYTEKSTNITYKRYGEKSVSKEQIKTNIQELYDYAYQNIDLEFYIVYQNEKRNLNGFSSLDIFAMFTNGMLIPTNIFFSDTFQGIETNEIKMIDIEVVNIKSNPEVKKQDNYVYCGRGSDLGNPFVMKDYSIEERDRVCDEHESYLLENLKSDNEESKKIKNQLNYIWNIARKKGSVKLGCFCAPLRCHCDTLKKELEMKFIESKKYN